jgi:hypothetical protein
MDEGKLHEQTQRAQRASTLLNDEAFVAAFDGLKAMVMARWILSKDPVERERIWEIVHLIDQVKEALATMAAHGRMAEQQLEDLTSGRAKKHFGVV